MPIELPVAPRPAPVLFQPDEVLAGTRVTRFTFQLLDQEERVLGEIDGVTGGGVEWTSGTAIKGGGSLEVMDRGQSIDWLNCRVHPTALISSIGEEDEVEYPLGVYLASAPVEEWDEFGRSWRVELLDKLCILDQDIVTDALTGDPVTFVAPIGANVIDTIIDLIEMVGETAPAIQADSKTLPASLTWDVGTPVLKIVNELLEAAGYASLWTDGEGQFRATPYVVPADRPPVYEALNPFSKGEQSLMAPEWTNDRDIYSIPNRYVAISQGSGDAEALVSVATNEDPASPFSYASRGRWVTSVVTGVEVTSQAELDLRARMGLAQSSSVASGISLKHVFLPLLHINETIRFRNPDAVVDLLCYVTKTSVDFDPVALCKSEIREAAV